VTSVFSLRSIISVFTLQGKKSLLSPEYFIINFKNHSVHDGIQTPNQQHLIGACSARTALQRHL
ncbi:MAG: hypothetical protein ABR512_15390, partial [Desulfopila sp.]